MVLFFSSLWLWPMASISHSCGLRCVCFCLWYDFGMFFRLFGLFSYLFCTRILEHFRSALFVFCSFAICVLSALAGTKKCGCQKSLRRFVPARLSAVFHTCPQPGPPTVTPTASATANYSIRAQWQMELGSCFRAPNKLLTKADLSALNALEFSLFWVSVARQFFMPDLQPPRAMDRPLKGANCPSPAVYGVAAGVRVRSTDQQSPRVYDVVNTASSFL